MGDEEKNVWHFYFAFKSGENWIHVLFIYIFTYINFLQRFEPDILCFIQLNTKQQFLCLLNTLSYPNSERRTFLDKNGHFSDQKQHFHKKLNKYENIRMESWKSKSGLIKMFFYLLAHTIYRNDNFLMNSDVLMGHPL